MYNPDKFYLGKLCRRGHDYEGTGKSLRYLNGNDCRECIRKRGKKKIETGENKRQTQEYYHRNKERCLRQRKQYYENNKEKVLKTCQAYKDKHKEWYREYGRQHYKKNKERYRKNRRIGKLRRDYGITPEDYNRMEENQEYRCLICNTYSENLVVDHCHTTGKVRGLLCDSCNRGIGFLGDDVQNLLNAAEYLEDN